MYVLFLLDKTREERLSMLLSGSAFHLLLNAYIAIATMVVLALNSTEMSSPVYRVIVVIILQVQSISLSYYPSLKSYTRSAITFMLSCMSYLVSEFRS